MNATEPLYFIFTLGVAMTICAPVSGAQFNLAVTIGAAFKRGSTMTEKFDVIYYVIGETIGRIVGN